MLWNGHQFIVARIDFKKLSTEYKGITIYCQHAQTGKKNCLNFKQHSPLGGRYGKLISNFANGICGAKFRYSLEQIWYLR